MKKHITSGLAPTMAAITALALAPTTVYAAKFSAIKDDWITELGAAADLAQQVEAARRGGSEDQRHRRAGGKQGGASAPTAYCGPGPPRPGMKR